MLNYCALWLKKGTFAQRRLHAVVWRISDRTYRLACNGMVVEHDTTLDYRATGEGRWCQHPSCLAALRNPENPGG